MSAIPSSVSAPVSPKTPFGTLTKSGQSPTVAKAVEKSAAVTNKSPSTIGPLGIMVLLSGICVAIGGILWAIELDVPVPLAIMAGYCTFIASACLCILLMVLRKAPAKVESVNAARGQPNYAAWKLVSKYSVSDASRLWCDIEPGCPASQESIAWAHALLDAIKRGELRIVPRSGLSETIASSEQASPTWHTEVARDRLQSWAQSHGHSPRFLQK
jgi:hypothetical protein